jgi:hypothetical protein
MKRFGLVGFAVATLVAMAAAPALAKGPDVRVSTTAVITGPGLKGPIVLRGNVSVYGFDGFEAPHNELSDVLLRSVGLQSGSDIGWYELAPDPGTLGPGYEITYTFTSSDSQQAVDVPLFGAGAKIDLTVPFRQVVYPYGRERPLVYTAPGQFFLNRMIGQWWSAPPSLHTWLVSKGLPAAPVAARVPARPPAVPELPTADAFPWAIAFIATALLAMVVTAALAGRRAQLGRRA